MSEWISVDEILPDYDKKVLIHIILQRNFGTHFETPVTITGWLTQEDGDDCWAVGDDNLLWDYDYNLMFTTDDVTHWAPLMRDPK